MSNFELLHNIFAFWAIWIRSRGKVAQRSPFAHFLEMKYFIRFWVLAVLIIVKKKLRWLQNLNIKSIHVCMSAVYLLRNDHYVISSRAINYFSLFEILYGCNWIIFCGEIMLHYFLQHLFLLHLLLLCIFEIGFVEESSGFPKIVSHRLRLSSFLLQKQMHVHEAWHGSSTMS